MKNKKILVVCGLILAFTSGAFANTTLTNIQVALNSVKIVVNGKTINQPNIIYNGVTYVPVNAVATELGNKVQWDASTRTVTIGNKVSKEVIKKEEPKKTKVSKEYENALKKAETYSSVMHMSKKGIYNQLTSDYGEKFPADAAQYAVDNLKADYKLNALEKAKSYQKSMSMSKQGIYDQLISEYGEQFTEEEAKYAIEHLE